MYPGVYKKNVCFLADFIKNWSIKTNILKHPKFETTTIRVVGIS